MYGEDVIKSLENLIYMGSSCAICTFAYAVRDNNLGVVCMLLANGIILNDDNVMYNVCKHGWMDIAKTLLKFDSSEFVCIGGLQGAIFKNQIEMAKLMIEHGATNKKCLVPSICQCSSLEMLELILENFEYDPINSCDEHGLTGLDIACIKKRSNLINILIKYDTHMKLDTMTHIGEKNLIGVARELSCNKWSKYWIVCLIAACGRKHFELAKFIVNNHVNDKDKMMVWIDGDDDIASFLYNNGFTNATRGLDEACLHRRKNTIKFLLNKGVEPSEYAKYYAKIYHLF